MLLKIRIASREAAARRTNYLEIEKKRINWQKEFYFALFSNSNSIQVTDETEIIAGRNEIKARTQGKQTKFFYQRLVAQRMHADAEES